MKAKLIAILFLATPLLQSSEDGQLELAVIIPESYLYQHMLAASTYANIFYGDREMSAYFQGRADVYAEWHGVIQRMKPKEK